MKGRVCLPRNVAAVLVLVITAACGSSPSPAPTPVSPGSGNWSGRITDETNGDGTFQLVLHVDGATATYQGTWTVTFTHAVASGAAQSAVVNPLPLALTCTPPGRAASSVTVTGSRMSGSYFTIDCAALTRGSLDLTKQ
jgi:hypothetical protein